VYENISQKKQNETKKIIMFLLYFSVGGQNESEWQFKKRVGGGGYLKEKKRQNFG
jgi:hypothetical protein